MNNPEASVAEVQGLYGAYSFSEQLLQKIWLRGDFDRRRAVTTGGEPVEIIHPGRWNRLGGPDFKDARVRIGDAGEITGDVELHLRAEDWAVHGHQKDPAYGRVVLHVVLFPPRAAHRTISGNGLFIPVLPLLALLHHDLEEFAAEDAVERLAARPSRQIVEQLGGLDSRELGALLTDGAEKRWRQKIRFARVRIDRLGWEAACHQSALEVLGYRFNRTPMLRVAEQFPLGAWVSGGAALLPSVLASQADAWSLQGVRPANQPRTRLQQYGAWVAARPTWPELLSSLGQIWPQATLAGKTSAERKAHALGAWRERVSLAIAGKAIGGTRWDTLIIDGLLPLLAARSGGDPAGFFGSWFHWFPGDLPTVIPRALRDLAVIGSAGQPAINGFAQGLLGWWWQHEGQRASGAGREA